MTTMLFVVSCVCVCYPRLLAPLSLFIHLSFGVVSSFPNLFILFWVFVVSFFSHLLLLLSIAFLVCVALFRFFRRAYCVSLLCGVFELHTFIHFCVSLVFSSYWYFSSYMACFCLSFLPVHFVGVLFCGSLIIWLLIWLFVTVDSSF